MAYWRFGPGEVGKEELQFFADPVRAIESEHRIDANRVYSRSISNGAQMTDQLGREMANTFAAIAPVSGALFIGEQCPI